ncbi:MAG: 2-hydroxyacyl-CoA dehydratase [Clostridia bacterium]|nr:2-hydroxyacyl-CoA dehydratase [Clostridia bacterium]
MECMAEHTLGLDIGSTTLKLVILNENQETVFAEYRRHLADVRGGLLALLREAAAKCGSLRVRAAVTGSGGLTVADLMGLPFIQEVVAGTKAAQTYVPQADVLLELGGEDAKITYMRPSLEQRMNGTCAGGTGAFIDQMAALLDTDAAGLNALAASHTTIYPIAARCGVFAKTDVQPLINDGAAKEDIAASILQAVVDQTVSGLACGRPVRGRVAFLGGPLHHLDQLRERFVQTLRLGEDEILSPADGHLFVAMGAALLADSTELDVGELAERLARNVQAGSETRRLAPLFAAGEREEFASRHGRQKVRQGDLAAYAGPCWLGIDAGSTTIKAVLMGEDDSLLYSHYASNRGRPLEAAVDIVREVYRLLPEEAWIGGACVTGYGEGMIKTALRLDEGEVETVAHYRAARQFDPEVDFIIDIGGQDMKCLRIRDGIISDIMLNEACSSGCGSFLETFAHSLGMPVADFAEAALGAAEPVDLGTRCTVFMNSRVKQAQKEGASVGDISAGLAYSVVKNALYKVIKVKDPAELGSRVVVQGGTFQNDAILRAFEKELGRDVIRPDIAGLMGAYGCALLARDRAKKPASGMLSAAEAEAFTCAGRPVRCQGCSNHCMLTVTTFAGGGRFVSGNRCEKGSGSARTEDVPNLYAYRLSRVFDYEPLPEAEAQRGEIGLPRALNMFENYPFWFTLLTRLGFRVVLSDPSSHDGFAAAMDTVPSDSVCYPAKLTHAHVNNLLERGIRRIFYPCIPHEIQEYPEATNNYNCPIVTSYPEVIRHNMEGIKQGGVDYICFFAALDAEKYMPKLIAREFSRFGVTREEARDACKAAYAELRRFKAEMERKGEETLAWLKENGRRGIVLSGRPYHLDPEINHGIPELITSYGLAVLTEESIAHLGGLERPIRVMDQWVYHTRLYESAAAVAKTECLELVQLNSFGCGLDAISTDQVQEILEASGKTYTLLKIDEISNLGAAKIRLRSLLAALQEGTERKARGSAVYERRLFTKKMREEGTIVCPQMAPLQFQFLKQAFDPTGYNFKVLSEVTREDIDVGLKYVNNDACYPTIIIVGQLVNAFLRGELDPDSTVIMLTQTGGGCRASNYLAFLRKALREAGFPQVVVASINFAGLERNPGLRFTPGMAGRLLIGMSLGDLLQKVLLATRPYEKNPGETNALYEKWVGRIRDITERTAYREYRRAAFEMVAEFDGVARTGEVKPKIGIVGEILVKFHPDANNHVIEAIEAEGGECELPALMEFFTYSLHSSRFKHEQMGKFIPEDYASRFGISLVNSFRRPVQKALAQSRHFEPFTFIEELGEQASELVSLGHCTGEGWFLTAEMLNLLRHGVNNMLCVQPFACLPNHVLAKGMIRAIRDAHPEANIVAVDYDPGASEVNQLNRIKLMLHTAFDRLQQSQKSG